MTHHNIPSFSARQRGMALVVALVLLLVMTMIAVVATRTTTVDLKMTTNTVLSRRAFQNSEGSRISIGKTLEDHQFHRGWPAVLGGSVPDTENFRVPDEIVRPLHDPTARFYLGTNGVLGDLGPPAFSRDPDMQFRLDTDDDNEPDNTDMFGDIWVTWRGTLPASGSGVAQGSGYLGPGVGSAGAGSHVYYDIRARGQAPGNAATVTGSDYRVLVRN